MGVEVMVSDDIGNPVSTDRGISARSNPRNEAGCPIVAALHRNPRGGMWRVHCKFSDGLALLHGKVASFYLKQLAQETAKNVEGVKLVINRVDVTPGHYIVEDLGRQSAEDTDQVVD